MTFVLLWHPGAINMNVERGVVMNSSVKLNRKPVAASGGQRFCKQHAEQAQ
jgi:hypothetical protein